MWCSTSLRRHRGDERQDHPGERGHQDVLQSAADLTPLLVGRDVLLIVDQNGGTRTSPTSARTGPQPMIGTFAVRGGTVIVLDGMANDQIPSLTYRVLVGPRSVSAASTAINRPVRSSTAQGGPGLQNASPTATPGPSTRQLHIAPTTPGCARSSSNVDQQVVLHRLF